MDFNGDGIVDILSGCYWSSDPDWYNGNGQAGYIYVLAGTKDGDFLEAKPLLTAEKKPLINVPLSDEALENYDTDNIKWGNICTAQCAVDYDGDGDLDLVVGEMQAGFYLHLNSADDPKVAPVFADLPIKLDLVLPGGVRGTLGQHSDPHLVDWDADGDLDLLSGSGAGSVYLSINEGSVAEPKWTEFECLIKNEAPGSQTTDNGQELKPGDGARVCVTDFNRDGKLDLLVGDDTTIENKIPGLTEKEKARLEKEYDEEMQPIQDAFQKVYEEMEEKAEKAKEAGDDDAIAKIREEVELQTEVLREKMMALREKEKLFRDHESTGHVWVYLQK